MQENNAYVMNKGCAKLHVFLKSDGNGKAVRLVLSLPDPDLPQHATSSSGLHRK